MQLNDYHRNIFKEVFSAEPEETNGFPEPSDVSAGIVYAISTLKEREKEVLSLRFEKGLTYKKMGEHLGLSASGARDVTDRVLRLLRHPTRANFIRYGYEGYMNKLESERQERAAQKLFNESQTGYIDELNLSVRTYNCLIRCGIHTISDCANYPNNPLKIRYLGKHSACEVANALRECGIKDTVWDEFL